MLNSVGSCCGGFTDSVLCGFAEEGDHLVCHLLLWQIAVLASPLPQVSMSVQSWQSGHLTTHICAGHVWRSDAYLQ